MKKGFTLIELLAVIVILAVIAVIAVPIVLNIINESKESAILRSAQFYIDGVQQSIILSRLNNKKVQDGIHPIIENGNICTGKLNDDNTCPLENILELDMNGEVPTEGTIKIKEGEVVKIDITLSDQKIWTNPFTGKLEYKLDPGLYDENDKLLASWDKLNEITSTKSAGGITFDELIKTGHYTAPGINPLDGGIVIDSIEGAYKLIIPGSVKSIAKNSFRSCRNLKSLIIEYGVETIGDFAFSNCANLTTVIISDSVESIGSSAFYECESLKEIVLSDRLTKVENQTFMYCTSLKEITIPDSVTSIGDGAFWGCTSLTNIIFPDTLEEISQNVFEDCTSLTKMIIPASVTRIGIGVCNNCVNLSNIVVDSNNKVYDSRDNSNAIIETATNTLIVGSNKTVIPASVTSIGNGTFIGRTELTSVIIPSSVVNIGANAFMRCTKLKTINYKGTEAQWNSITKTSGWDMGTPSDKVINYNYNV